ncbi:MAG: META domain-containing protein [Bacteroidetes bacterium]|nr:META domain-containing protein [Bacteroidota bacterium]
MIYSISFIALLSMLLSSCSINRQAISGNDWKVESIKAHPDSALNNASQNYILSLKEKDFTLKLDVNNCFGKFSIQNQNIDFQEMACTEICCDSKYAMSLANILRDVYKYKTTKSGLKLFTKNQREIYLKQVTKTEEN